MHCEFTVDILLAIHKFVCMSKDISSVFNRRKRIEPEFDEYKEEPDKAPMFSFPLRDRFIQEGVGVKLIASLTGKPQSEVRQ